MGNTHAHNCTFLINLITKSLISQQHRVSFFFCEMAVEKTSDQSIPLRPFRDQVGGNFMLLEIDDNYICKPLQARETLFYETLPEELKMFTPEYKGIVFCSYVLFCLK